MAWEDVLGAQAANSKTLAQFLFDHKLQCSKTKVRITAHSLGSRTVFKALKWLNLESGWLACDNPSWNKNDWKVQSATTSLGATMDDRSVKTNSECGACRACIEGEVKEFQNKCSTEDDFLRNWHLTDEPLGLVGVETKHKWIMNSFKTQKAMDIPMGK